ncbi:MAG TPA: OmpA family protein, partial [Pseudomonadota bacterium]|nr:OmpA family protein [Pseudomonadota bacterium]
HCPEEKGPAENNGCPERDTDRDGIVDRLDDCPTLPGRKALHGCPRVYADQNKIKVLERIHFATDQDVILPESFGVLEEIADYIKAHPEWLEILIEGHCDFRADDAYNLNLSQRRASAVLKFLLLRGVEPGRLKAQGFGKSRPIADNSTEEGMALNRRVEFTILKVAPGHQLPVLERPDQVKIEPVLRSQN